MIYQSHYLIWEEWSKQRIENAHTEVSDEHRNESKLLLPTDRGKLDVRLNQIVIFTDGLLRE